MSSEKGSCCFSQKMFLLPLAIVFALALMAGVIYFGVASFSKAGAPASTIAINSSNPQLSLIFVSAEASKEVTPDKAEIVFSVISKGKDPAGIQSENDAAASKIMSAIKNLGVPQENIKTVGYSLEKWVEWQDSDKYPQGRYVELGYIITNRIRVVTYNIDKAGAILKAAVDNGANEVDSVSFGLSDSLRTKAYNELLKSAAAMAGEKAKSIADASGVRIKRLFSINEGYSYIEPMPLYNYQAGMKMPLVQSASITPGLARVSASISASYEIE